MNYTNTQRNSSRFLLSLVVNSLILLFFFFTLSFGQSDKSIQLNWMGGKTPAISTGVSWGVPLPEGMVNKDDKFLLEDSRGHYPDVQHWPLAYWPDGSVKWTGLSTVVNEESGSSFRLKVVETANPLKDSKKISLRETSEGIHINTGAIECYIPLKGEQIIKSLKIGSREICSGGRLICILQNGPEQETGPQPSREKYTSRIDKVSIEQSGPVRSVIKMEGRHYSSSENREFLPFILRLYFYAGQQTVKIMHTIIYDGDQHSDFIAGLGVEFDLPMEEDIYNRHIRFSGENDHFWSEPVQPLTGRRILSRNPDYYQMQIQGKRIPERETLSEKQNFLIENWASWNDFKLNQSNADGFRIQKRTNDQSAWIDAGSGGRSSGLVYAGDVSGGLAVCMRDFWQSFPSALEVKDARTPTAKIRAWLWSPESPAMDMRHYDTLAWGHNLEASYEDVQPGFSTPEGVGRTSEFFLYAAPSVPSVKTLETIAQQGNHPPLLTVTPEYLHSIPVFGAWSLPDRSSKGKQWIEDQLDKAFEYYRLEVEQRNWYGYWDYGDVMHAYDPVRHSWRYDIGGYAWDNTELMPNLWLWYSYLRSGNEDIFRMAEAMTRHTGEVDVYHLGPFEGLGSRHNVRHWGCGAKEVRISQAALSRFYYYLTTDERTGDLMSASAEASNKAIGRIDPVRLILKKDEHPTHIRMGPDWLALVGNWMTEWERTGEESYKNKILTGVECLYNMPYGFFSGNFGAVGYDPETYKLYQLDKNDISFNHLAVLMGGPEVAFELSSLLDNEKWDKLWLQYCALQGESETRIEKEFGRKVSLGRPEPFFARLPAYYARETGNKKYAKKAWNNFLSNKGRYTLRFEKELIDKQEILAPVYEVKGVSTNSTAQWCLNAIELLELAGDQIPDDHPLFKNKKLIQEK